MNDNNATATLTLDEWCATVRDMHAAMGAPIESEDDPRFVELLASLPVLTTDKHTAGELGDMYFEQFATVPTPPLPVPVWAESVKVSTSIYPAVLVEFVGPLHTDGSETARVEQGGELFAEVDSDRDGAVHLPGDFVTAGPSIYLSERLDDLDAGRAESLARVLVLAAADLRRA